MPATWPRISRRSSTTSACPPSASRRRATPRSTPRPPPQPRWPANPRRLAQAPRQQTRELTRDDWQPQEPEYQPVSGQFAGVDLDEFYWARQRAKRALMFWVVAVLTLTGLIAAGAWTIGGNIGALL